MATNFFEKYGIKEVADVTLFRIEKKDETYESQRKISISSILKGALSKQMVYPLDEDGKGESEGYEAYVFKDADILTHFNYDCDDKANLKGTALFVDKEDKAEGGESIDKLITYLTTEDSGSYPIFTDPNSTILSLVDADDNSDMLSRYQDWLVNGYEITISAADAAATTAVPNGEVSISTGSIESIEMVTYKAKITEELNYADVSGIDSIIEEGGEKYITFTAPKGASPDVVRANFAIKQAEIYNAAGIIARFTQPVIVSDAGSVIDGELVITITDGNDTETATVTFVEATVSNALAYAIRNGITTKAQVEEVLALADDTTVTVVYGTTENAFTTLLDNATSISSAFDAETYKTYMVTFTASIASTEEAGTGIYAFDSTDAGHYHMDPDTDNAGTHEFTYPEQICMLFAKHQNLITKAGTRYKFANPNTMFTGFEFDDNFAAAPNSKEQVVVVGLAGRISENLYDEKEINDAIKELTDTIEAKAYDITYTDYAEIVVEDEMGYYLPQQLGYAYDKRTKAITLFGSGYTYAQYAESKRGIDLGIESAVYTWGDGKHYSINDAIDALKQESKVVDNSTDTVTTGATRVFGGYKVTGKNTVTPPILDDSNNIYDDYYINGQRITSLVTGQPLDSGVALDDVLSALAVADLGGLVGQVRISSTAEFESNRAIYVNPENGVLANRANIYLLKNVNSRTLTSDKAGIFEFYDKKGNRLYYQDKVFAGTKTLALVAIGTMGLIFVVEKYGTKNINKIAWMVKDHGYITDKQAERIVKNGLIHTVDITVCDETFDATCTVGAIKVRKIKKNVLHYVPVLFLDTLKVSTLEQATETTDARGGRGNAKLITWDYGKEITLSIEDALYTPASMAAIWAGENGDLKNGVKDAKQIDRFQKYTAAKAFIVPAGNHEGTPTEGDGTAQAVYYDPKTMEPYQDGTPIAVGEVYYKFTRSVAYGENSLGKKIEISADKFPGTYRVVGETMVRQKEGGKDQRFQFIIPEAKMSASDATITLEADGDPTVFSFSMDVLRPESGNMMEFIQFDVEDNEAQGDGSDMVKDTEDLNLVDDAEMFRTAGETDEELVIGATEY